MKVLATTALIGLGIAGPALGSDGEEPMPPMPGLPDAVAPATPTPAPSLESSPPPLPELPPTPAIPETAIQETGQETPQVVTTQSDAGSVNVSVRVLSPGTDGPVTQESSLPEVVSGAAKPDITPAAEPTATMPPAAPDSSQPTAVNTNVAVRVLSPGDNGPVSQTNSSVDVRPSDESVVVQPAGGESGVAERPTSNGSNEQAAVSDVNSPRYQESDSQYQSNSETQPEPWNWNWELALDCEGNATSLSTQTGSQTSLIWTWDWAWDWSCAGTDSSITSSGSSISSSGSSLDSSSTSDATNTNVSVRVLSPGDNDAVTESNTSAGSQGGVAASEPAPSGGPWTWSWVFTFCGQTTSFSTQMESQTPLSWTWDWAWNWTCDAAMGAPPEAGNATQPGTDATPVPPLSVVIPAAPAPQAFAPASAPTVEIPPLPPLPPLPAMPSVDVGVAIVVEPGFPQPELPDISLTPRGVPGVEVSVVVVPEPSPTVTPGVAMTPDPAHKAPTHRAEASSAPRGTTTAVAWPPPASPSSRPISQPTTKRASAHPASPRRSRGPLLPFGAPSSSQTAGSGTLGGRVPSTPVAAVAALIAFFMLAAPTLGRRIRVARELSPRSTYRSSIDHPG